MPQEANPHPHQARRATLAVRWLLSGEWRPALLVALVFVAYMLAQVGSISGLAAESRLVTVVACLLIFGVFLGVVFVTETNEVPEAIAARKCVLTGCIACSSIAVIIGAGLAGIALGTLVGAVLGYTAPWWSQGV
jgi:hypothetical protein